MGYIEETFTDTDAFVKRLIDLNTSYPNTCITTTYVNGVFRITIC